MAKIWKILPKSSDDLITQLLKNRGLNTKGEIEKFFNPKLSEFESLIKISGISSAQKRIKKAIEKKELIVVYGDYDVDGVCASAILYKGLTSIGAKVLPYIPHRDKEGYGLSKLGLEFARDSGANLVITVDNGIVAIEQARFAKEIGLDLIITDHHLPLETLPIATAIVHSTKMCGGGVAWCLIRDMVSESLAKDLLQFVAIATIGDLIPLTGLGRAFAVEGIKQIRKTTNVGIISLLNECNIELNNIGSYEIGHILIPRLNAIGRLEHAIDALRLLCTKDPAKAKSLAKLLCETNLRRQELTTSAVEEAKILIGKNNGKKIHILGSEKWSSGIIGLVAARITEEYFRPTIALSIGEMQAKGSARSLRGINIVEIIRKTSDILIDVGGHQGAAGFTILNDKIDEFKKRLEDLMDGVVEEETQVIEVEAEIESNKLTKSLAKEIERFEPFGFGNLKPVFATKAMRLSDIRTVGAEGKHLKLKADGIDVIAFGMGNFKELLSPGSLADIAYFLEINKYNGVEILQLKVKDIKINSGLN